MRKEEGIDETVYSVRKVYRCNGFPISKHFLNRSPLFGIQHRAVEASADAKQQFIGIRIWKTGDHNLTSS
jgi:hypothetical protein